MEGAERELRWDSGVGRGTRGRRTVEPAAFTSSGLQLPPGLRSPGQQLEGHESVSECDV